MTGLWGYRIRNIKHKYTKDQDIKDTGGEQTQKGSQGIPLRDLDENCTCEAGGSKSNWPSLGSVRV